MATEIEEVTVEVKGWIMQLEREDGTLVFTWQTQYGESRELFDSAEEARYDLIMHFDYM